MILSSLNGEIREIYQQSTLPLWYQVREIFATFMLLLQANNHLEN